MVSVGELGCSVIDAGGRVVSEIVSAVSGKLGETRADGWGVVEDAVRADACSIVSGVE